MAGKRGRSREECSANEQSGKGWEQEDAGQLGSRVGGVRQGTGASVCKGPGVGK